MSAEDGAFEMPYLTTFGSPSQYHQFFPIRVQFYLGFEFENIKVLIDIPKQAFVLGND